MQERLVVEAIASEEHADSGLRAEIAAAELVELRDGLACVVDFAEFQICFGEQVEILRLVGMLGDFVGDLLQVEFGAVAFGKIRSSADVIEKILKWVRAGRGVFRKSLKNAKVAFGGFVLMKIALDHGEFVVAGGGILGDFDVFAEERRRFGELFAVDAEICEFEQRFGHVGLVAQRLLKQFFRALFVALARFDVAEIEQARWVARIFFQAGLEIFSRFIETPEVAIGKSHEGVGRGGGVEFDERFENLDRFFVFAGHEVAFAERGAQVGAFRRKLDAGFEQRDRVFEIVLRHAHAGEQKDNVGILWRGLVCTDEQVERIGRFSPGGNRFRRADIAFRASRGGASERD